MLLGHLLGNFGQGIGLRSLTGTLDGCRKGNGRCRKSGTPGEQEEMLQRRLFHLATFLLFESDEPVFQHFWALRSMIRGIGLPQDGDLHEMIEVGTLCRRVNKDGSPLCLLLEAITDE